MKYLRVVLAYDPKDEDMLNERLDEFIEADDDEWNGVQGAYVSTPYDDRDGALHGPWQSPQPPSGAPQGQ